MSERVVENEWREQAFDRPQVAHDDAYGMVASLDHEIELLGQDIGGLAAVVAERVERISALRRQVADIARTLP